MTLEEAFPEVDPGCTPFGDRVLVQLRNPKLKTKGGILLTEETRDFDKNVRTVAKVIALGPLAYRDRDNPEKMWPEGAWCKPGDFVRVPKWGGDRWQIPLSDDEYDPLKTVTFAIYRDREIIGKITCDPLLMKDYV